MFASFHFHGLFSVMKVHLSPSISLLFLSSSLFHKRSPFISQDHELNCRYTSNVWKASLNFSSLQYVQKKFFLCETKIIVKKTLNCFYKNVDEIQLLQLCFRKFECKILSKQKCLIFSIQKFKVNGFLWVVVLSTDCRLWWYTKGSAINDSTPCFAVTSQLFLFMSTYFDQRN